MKKAFRETQTLRAGCSNAESKIFARGRGQPKFNQLEMVTTHYLYLQTQFGEDRCTQFRVIAITDPQTNKHSYKPTNRLQDRLQYTAPLCLARSVIEFSSSELILAKDFLYETK